MTSIIGKTNKYGRSSHLRCSSLFSRAASGSNSLLSGNMTGRGGNKAFRLRLRGRKFTALEHHVPPPLVAGYEDEYRRRARTHRAARREVLRTRKCDVLKHYHGCSLTARRRAA